MMKRLLGLVTLLVCALVAPTYATDFYCDALNGSDANNSLTPGAPSKTINGGSGVKADGFGNNAGDRLFVSGTFREQLRLNNAAGNNLNYITIQQWPGKPQAIFRGDTVIALTSFTFVDATNGVFTYTVPAGTLAFWNNSGTHRTLTEGICDVVVDWDFSIDAQGRHFGHLTQVIDDATVLTTTDTWHFTPPAPAASGGGGGTLKIHLSENFVSTAALQASGLTIAYVAGNLDGFEIGTPTYTTYPTWGAYTGVNVNNLVIDGIDFYLWSDSGYRKNKPVSSGSGDDSSAFGAGNSLGTVSIGYSIRIADGNNCRVSNCKIYDPGYHPLMFVGDRCTQNTAVNVMTWGGALNSQSGGSAGMFYTGPGLGVNNDITGCRAYFCDSNLYTFLGRNGVQTTFPWRDADGNADRAFSCRYDGFLNHTNARNGVATVVADSGSTATFSYSGMFAGETIVVTASTTPTSLVGTYVLSSGGGTFVIPIDPNGAGTADWYSKSNSVVDVQYEDCTVRFFGTRTSGSACVGEPFLAGGQGSIASNTRDWESYPVRYLRCKTFNAATNLISSNGDVGFKDCYFGMDRAGNDAMSLAAVPAYLGGAMGSLSGRQNMGFFGCSFVCNLSSTTDANRNLFYLNFNDNPNKLVFLNCSFYNTGTRADTANNNQAFFFVPNDVTGVLSSALPDRVYARQCVFAQLWCAATTDIGGPARNLVSNGYTGFGDSSVQSAWNVRDCMYSNFDNFITYGGGVHSLSAEIDYVLWADTTGVYLKRDPTIALIATGASLSNPYADISGYTLDLTGWAKTFKKSVPGSVSIGSNGLEYDGSYGAFQYGSPAWSGLYH
jgi:hypothetical protein